MNSHGNMLGDTSLGSLSMSHVRSSSTSLITDATASILSHEDELSKVQIYRDLCEYEETLGHLITSVDNFKPDVKIAKKLIDVDKSLFKSLGLFAEYDKIDSELKRLERESEEIDKRTKDILETLNDCYNKLNTLPMLEQVCLEKDMILQERTKINSTVLLDYATKLSKFTKIPPTFDKGAIGPNNFIWPAEDALRRGMLAMASLHTKELTRVPGQPDEQDTNEQDTNEQDTNEPILENQRHILEQSQEDNRKHDHQQLEQWKSPHPPLERRQSYVFTGDGESPNDKGDDAIDLDLDLFNADEF